MVNVWRRVVPYTQIVSACASKCPKCGEPCVGGAHPGGQHGCVNGHSW